MFIFIAKCIKMKHNTGFCDIKILFREDLKA